MGRPFQLLTTEYIYYNMHDITFSSVPTPQKSKFKKHRFRTEGNIKPFTLSYPAVESSH